MLDLRLKGWWCETPEALPCDCVFLCLILVQPRKTGNNPDMTEKLLTGT